MFVAEVIKLLSKEEKAEQMVMQEKEKVDPGSVAVMQSQYQARFVTTFVAAIFGLCLELRACHHTLSLEKPL